MKRVAWVVVLMLVGNLGVGVAEVLVDNIEVPTVEDVSEHARVKIRGHLSDTCTTIELFEQGVDLDSRTLWVRIGANRPPDVMCAQVLTPFEDEVELGILGLDAGSWTVRVGDHEAALLLTRERSSPDPLSSTADTVWIEVPEIALRFPVPAAWERDGRTWRPPGTHDAGIGIDWISQPHTGQARAILPPGSQLLVKRDPALAWADESHFFALKTHGSYQYHTVATRQFGPIVDLYASAPDEAGLQELRQAHDRMAAAATLRRRAIDIEDMAATGRDQDSPDAWSAWLSAQS